MPLPNTQASPGIEHECHLQLLRKLTAEADEAEYKREKAAVELALQKEIQARMRRGGI